MYTKLKDIKYVPNESNRELYQKIYSEYKKLYQEFGTGMMKTMKNLKNIRNEINSLK